VPMDGVARADVHGSTDTEIVFQLALSLGLKEDPVGALERTVGLIESVADGTASPTFGVSDPSSSTVSEPFSDLPGLWNEIPAGSAVIARAGAELEHQPFRPDPAGADGLAQVSRPSARVP
jgi:hypothetical protein